ncbi:MAG: 4-hydroxy-tetrahydrodipicolinate reductase [Bacteroidales bacterium]|jgi:4-hydroxy-tetrahydrodipicolinate reductase
MKIILSGYGKMGRAIEQAAVTRQHEIVARLDAAEDWTMITSLDDKPDVVMEFSTPMTAVENIRRTFDLGLPIVAGTTGWLEHEETVRKWCSDEKQALFTASNFSIGVNILFDLTKRLSSLLEHFDDFDVSIEEIHHIQKLDRPSGTAVTLARMIIDKWKRKEKWVNRETDKAEELEIISKRVADVFGIHTIRCASESDRLTLTHEALNRQGFAKGALLAAEWLKGKTGYFGMNDMLCLDR